MAAAGSSNILVTCLALLLLSALFILPGLRQPTQQARDNKAASRIDGRAIDQGVAYALMLAALLVTYICH
ncbi:hypothetical protein BAE44_0015671 [Dichanthelium oligosanthes]|uniref:Uncharacterized protein n=1 Tax=Dichanthelium oligosanthes TaxID=888268 RepID=A0A1E5VDT3_9POAL|nr:hypothetical protein BAE44_0015671 [Dichanthelium oligosanthes]